MPNISGLLYIARNSLVTQQKAIDITGNNIANVNTEGYSRQRLVMEQNTPVRNHNTTLSTGVSANQAIQRYYDEYVVNQLNNENEDLGRWEAQKSALAKVESLVDEVSGYGLSSAMSDFWGAWQDLINNPSGEVERTNLLSTSQYMSSVFNELSSNIAEVREDIDTSITSDVDEINQLSGQIAELNLKIAQVEITGHNANDYRDERDQLILNLSKLVDVSSFEDNRGYVNISVVGGKPLVDGTATWELTTVNNAGLEEVHWVDSSGATQNITQDIDSGELKGWIEARDELITDYQGRLDELAATIIGEINAIHGAGFGLNGTTGDDFFTGTTATNMAVNSDIEADVDRIAAASDLNALPGDNSNAIDIYNLQSTLTMSGGNATFDDFYATLVYSIGSDVNRANTSYEHETAMVSNMEAYRQEVSGVSLDEEMVNLVSFQHAYNAAAKMITTVDEMMQTLIAMKS